MDLDLLYKKVAFIQTCVRDLKTLARLDDIEADIRERRFVEHTLQVAIQAALDIASHIVSSERLGEPKTNRELFGRIVAAGWVREDLGEVLMQMAGFRDVLVHGYADVDVTILRDVVRHHLGDLLGFVKEVQNKLQER